MKIAVYPGSFDPITLGHLDIIKRSAKIFDKVYILIGINNKKHSLFTVAERIEMIKKCTNDLTNIIIDASNTLVVEYAMKVNANVIIRGLRNINDYQDEMSLFQFNHTIAPSIDTFALFPTANNLFVSSSSIKELVTFGADISNYVPKEVKSFIEEKIKERIKG